MKAVRLQGVNFSYPGGEPVLHDISFEIDAGSCTGLIGPNGAGKSTLLLLLNGLLRGEGEIEVLGLSPSHRSIVELRRRVGIVFQDPDDQLFMPVVLEDVALGPLNLGASPAEAERLAREALDRVGMAHAAARAPHRLSLGQRKRVALAAVLAMDPQVLVLDEPTAGLDPRGRHEFLCLLRTLTATRLIATHDLALVGEVCDRVIVLDEGRVVAQGRPEDILQDRALLAAHGLAPADAATPESRAV